MKLKALELKKLEIPFRVSFKHAAAERNGTEGIIAVAHGDSDIRGYGEGCPRSYVTGESLESCMHFADAHRNSILTIDSIDSLREFITGHRSAIDKNPAAWCAIETALLDWLGKMAKKSIEQVIGIPAVQGNFHYTAVLGVSSHKVFDIQLAQYLKLGFSDFKVKVSGDLETDTANIAAIRIALPNAKIRLDANNLWAHTGTGEAIAYLGQLPPNFWAIEEPIAPYDYAGLKILANELACKIILDESFLRIEDLTNLLNETEIWIPNIRISKMGGLLRALAMAEECKMRGVEFIIGAQVGETSILSRVAISLANTYRELVVAQEGAYGTYLLDYDITDAPIMFSYGGILTRNQNSLSGLGLNLTLENG